MNMSEGRKGNKTSKEREREGVIGEVGEGVSSHPTQSSTLFHPSFVLVRRLTLLHQHHLLLYSALWVCVCVHGHMGNMQRKLYE